MRYEKTTLPTFLMAALLSALISLSALMCLNESFFLGCQVETLLPLCALMGGGAALSVFPRRYWPILAAEGVALFLFVEWNWEQVLGSFQKLLYQITLRYSTAYGVKVMGLSAGESFLALLLLGLALSVLTAWVCSGRHNAIPVAVLCLPVLVLCLLIVDMAPAFWLVLLSGSLVLLLMTNSTRLHDAEQGGKLAWYLTPAVALLLAALLVLSPPAAYQRGEWMRELQHRAESLMGWEQPQAVYAAVSSAEWDDPLRQVDLETVGPRYRTGIPVLEYRTDTAIAYLRGVSLGVYEDNTWRAIDPALFAGKFIYQPLVSGLEGDHLLEIRTKALHPQQYITYFLNAIPEGAATVDDAYLKNVAAATEYSNTYSLSQLFDLEPYDQYVAEQYTQLPDDLRQELERFLAENALEDLSPRALAAFVQRLGIYDLNTPAVPEGEDFVLYFLQQSHQGYCVHFASATTLLLRAQGVPARYVTGYSVTGDMNQWNIVTEDEAHAWVEYYQPGIGWQPVDPTPADWRATPGERPPNPDEPEPELPPLPDDLPGQPDLPDLPEEPDPPERPDQPEKPNVPGTPETPSAGIGDGDGTGGRPALQIRLSPKLLWLLTLPGAYLLLEGRRRLVLRHRRKKCTAQPPNQCMLAMWRWLERLCKAGERPPAEEMRRLAEKARFSQHTVTPEELAQMEAAIERGIENLQTLKLLGRLWYKYGTNLF